MRGFHGWVSVWLNDPVRLMRCAAYLTFMQNFAWERSGLLGAGATGLTWPLAVEEQFYLLLPVLVRT
jgi:peptidoglycan/LPS O-acetylase OafA/YrhL